MSSLALAQPEVLDPTALDDLASTANREHEAAVGAAGAMIRHAIAAGEALLAAQAQTKPGQWMRWLEDRFAASPETAAVYMNIAFHREAVLAHPEITSISRARVFLRELGHYRKPLGSHGRGVSVPESVREEARALRREGKQYREIADLLGHSTASIYCWCNPPDVATRKVRHARAKAARREASRIKRRLDSERQARAVGGTVARSMSAVIKAVQEVSRAAGAEENVEIRAALNEALTKLHGAEDAVVRALGIAYGARDAA